MSENKTNEIKYFSEKPPFINRKEETKYFLEYFNSAPTNILFVYWPKSTGKTTLIKKVIKENLSTEKYDINYLNLRNVLLRNFTDFKNLFFPENLKWKTKKLLWTIWEIGAFWLKWNPWEEHIMETNIFWLMEDKLIKLNKAWIKPVIILDEFQYLKNIKFDSTLPDTPDNRVIEELFKFFIAMTKQDNLAHVVCLTSDSYYMEELYNDTKLSNTTKFYLIDHLKKEDIYYWLEEKENCPKEMVEDVWENLWWSVWEIWQVLVSYKNTWDYKKKLEDLLKVKFSLVAEYYREKLDKKNKESFLKIIKEISEKWKYIIWLDENYIELIKELVDKDIWFYDPKESKITANSKSHEMAFARLLKEISKK